MWDNEEFLALRQQNKILVTGGAGFIGSALCRHLVLTCGVSVCNVDKLTYAGLRASLKEIEGHDLYTFKKADICDRETMRLIIDKYQPDAVMHLAAESHVDRSIAGPAPFLETNVLGTYTLLEVVRAYWSALSSDKKSAFCFHHISTDEVYGSLGEEGLFAETTPYDPHSPYAASKAASDHLVKAWFHTYGLPVVLTNSSNNFGPYQYPEKLIPFMIVQALHQHPLPIYGKGDNVRDWLYVDDHVKALVSVVEKGRLGETYNVGGRSERTNLEVVETICDVLDQARPREAGRYRDLISFVEDRPGHDQRYAIDTRKMKQELGWQPAVEFDAGLRSTVDWYLHNESWWKSCL